MVCLYQSTLTAMRKSLTEGQLNDYPLWSWLIYNLADYIYYLEPRPPNSYPHIPSKEDDSIYGQWFYTILSALKETFYDANKEHLYQCLHHVPHENVASIIFDATPLDIQIKFMYALENFSIANSLEPISDDDMPALEPICYDDMPALKAV